MIPRFVADAVGASKAHVWELETGKSKNPSMELVTKLAEHFGVPVAQLMGEDPEAAEADQELVAMFRDLKDLTPRDREILRLVEGRRNLLALRELRNPDAEVVLPDAN